MSLHRETHHDVCADHPSKTIAIVTYPGVALLDFVVTQTVLDRGTRYRTVTVVSERTGPSDTSIPEKRFEEVPDPWVNTAKIAGTYAGGLRTHKGSGHLFEHRRSVLGDLVQQGSAGYKIVGVRS